MGNIIPLFSLEMQITHRNRLFVTVKEEQLQVAQVEIINEL